MPRPREGNYDATVATRIVEELSHSGVSVVYGVPGGQNLAIVEAIRRSDSVQFVATHHELAAVGAAEGHFRATGELGVALVTTGPGVTHAMSGIAGAFCDGSAVLLMSCQNPRAYLDAPDAQAANHWALLSSCVKTSVLVADSGSVTRVLRDVVRQALTGRPGPTHVDFPRDLLDASCPEVAGSDHVGDRPQVLRAGVAAGLAGEAAQLLYEAHRPVIWAGAGVRQDQSVASLRVFAERYGIPVVTTFSGIGLLDWECDVFFGPATSHGTRLGNGLLDEADVVFALGQSLSSASTGRWRRRLPRLIHSDVDVRTLGRFYRTDVKMWGFASDVLDATDRALATLGPPVLRTAWLAQLGERKARWSADMDAYEGVVSGAGMHPLALMRAIEREMGPGSVLVSDAGNAGIWSHTLRLCHDVLYLKPVDYGQMGFAVPAAIGAARALPKRPVTAIVGDGSMGMGIADIETAVREGLRIAVVVMNDAGYANIRQAQGERGLPAYGVSFGSVSYAAAGAAFGAHDVAAASPDEVAAALRRHWARSSTVSVIDARVDPGPSVRDGLF